MECPVCSSQKTRKIKSSTLVFQFSADRECSACRTVWRPACPTWGAVLAILLGTPLALFLFWFLVGYLIECFNEKPPNIVAILGGTIVMGSPGIAAASGSIYGFRVIFGAAGKTRILSQGAEGEVEEAEEVS